MAQSSFPPEFRPAVIDALRGALAAHLREPSPDGDLHRALRSLAAEAKSANVGADQLMPVLRDICDELPQTHGDDAHRRIVELLISEYYGTDLGTQQQRDPGRA